MENPRGKIVRFENWEEKKQIWRNLRGKPPIEYEEKAIQIFQDLSQETLRRRRTLQLLLKILQEQEIQYNWGFPACLIARRNRHIARLRFTEEIPDFCKKLEIPTPENTRDLTTRQEIMTQDKVQWQLTSRT